MSEDFPISLSVGHSLRIAFRAQILNTPKYPTQSFANQTVIVTGANSGLGLEAARHFYRLNCAKLIITARSTEKGEAAKEDIVKSVPHRDDSEAIEIWTLDLANTKSVLTFAERVKNDLPRVDVLIENAGANNNDWKTFEGFEQTIQVNTLNTLLMALLLLPKLRATKTEFPDSSPHLVIISSEAHQMTKFNEINAPDLFAKLNEKPKSFNGQDR
jgi:NAD(P)-dependent dehydrogenase (short-subunit alcohol dehydrogenase family)